MASEKGYQDWVAGRQERIEKHRAKRLGGGEVVDEVGQGEANSEDAVDITALADAELLEFDFTARLQNLNAELGTLGINVGLAEAS